MGEIMDRPSTGEGGNEETNHKMTFYTCIILYVHIPYCAYIYIHVIRVYNMLCNDNNRMVPLLLINISRGYAAV